MLFLTMFSYIILTDVNNNKMTFAFISNYTCIEWILITIFAGDKNKGSILSILQFIETYPQLVTWSHLLIK